MHSNKRDNNPLRASSQPEAFKQPLVPEWKLYNLCFPNLSGGLNFPPHYHSEVELWAIPPGIRGTVTIDGIAFPVEGGVFFFIRPDRIHSCDLQFQGTKEICAIKIHQAALRDVVASCNYEGNPGAVSRALDSIAIVHRSRAARLHNLLYQLSMIRAVLTNAPSRTDLQATLDSLADLRILTLIFTILLKEDHAPASTRTHHGVRRVLDLVEVRFSESLTQERISKECGLSQSSLCRSFKKSTGMTLWSYLSMVRVNHAQKLLEAQEKNVSEICYECGFQDVSYFVKVFRRFTGTTPKKWTGRPGRKPRFFAAAMPHSAPQN